MVLLVLRKKISSALFTPPAQYYNDLFFQKLAKEPEPLKTEYLFIVMLLR